MLSGDGKLQIILHATHYIIQIKIYQYRSCSEGKKRGMCISSSAPQADVYALAATFSLERLGWMTQAREFRTPRAERAMLICSGVWLKEGGCCGFVGLLGLTCFFALTRVVYVIQCRYWLRYTELFLPFKLVINYLIPGRHNWLLTWLTSTSTRAW